MTFRNTSSLGLAAVLLGAIGCGGARIHVQVRPDIDTSKSKVLVLPLLLSDGQKIRPDNASYSNEVADQRFVAEWNVDVGDANVVAVSKGVLDSLPGAYDGISTLTGNLNAMGTLERSTGLTTFLQLMSTKFLDGALAFALVFESEKEYNATKIVHVNLGLFDAKALAWKWITKGTWSSGLLTADVPYQTAIKNLIGESFADLKKKNEGAIR